MNEFPELVTNRLILGKLRILDIPKIVEYAGNPKVAATTLNIPYPYHEEDAVFWINAANQGFASNNQFTFGVRLKATDEFIGGIGIRINSQLDHGEFGYWIAEPFWNQGFATEALGAILKFGFERLHLHKIFAFHLIENPSSEKVMLKNGMIKEGELKDHTKKGNEYKSLVQYRLTKDEFF